jgi:mercuric ion binding protein
MKFLLLLLAPLLLFAGVHTAQIKISGMTCPLCTTAIKKSLMKTPGVLRAKVKLNSETATVTYDDNTTQKALLEAIEKAGYKGVVVSVK